jgi:hypothetical protein
MPTRATRSSRDLAQINADMVRTIAERFGNVMQATADVLRAADGAGLPRRQPSPPPPPVPDEYEEDEDEEDEDAAHVAHPSERMWAIIEPMLPAIGAWVASMVAKRSSSPPAAATTPSAPASDAASPSAEPATAGVAAGPSAPEQASATAPAAATAPVAAAAPVAATAPATATAPVAATTTVPQGPAPAAAAPTSSTPSAAATSEIPPHDGTAPITPVIADAMPAGAAQIDGPRNAPPTLEPTPEQWAHLFAVRSRLSPRESTIVDTVVVPPARRDRTCSR